jgi:hypothetical protein
VLLLFRLTEVGLTVQVALVGTEAHVKATEPVKAAFVLTNMVWFPEPPAVPMVAVGDAMATEKGPRTVRAIAGAVVTA